MDIPLTIIFIITMYIFSYKVTKYEDKKELNFKDKCWKHLNELGMLSSMVLVVMCFVKIL